jgi:hypothetical protein
MGFYDAEVIVQDLDKENSEIYRKGRMYIGGAKDSPLYFAPYFTKENEKPGLYEISRVIAVERASVFESHLAERLANKFRDNEQTANWEMYWCKGLALIKKRALVEGFPQGAENKLYFLGRPLAVRITPLMKSHRFRQIPRGYSLSIAEILTLDEIGKGQEQAVTA